MKGRDRERIRGRERRAGVSILSTRSRKHVLLATRGGRWRGGGNQGGEEGTQGRGGGGAAGEEEERKQRRRREGSRERGRSREGRETEEEKGVEK